MKPFRFFTRYWAAIGGVLFVGLAFFVGIFCYQWIWYDIFIAYFTMAQVVMHCFKMNGALKSWYCPGCFSALFVMLPLGIYFLVWLAGAETFPSCFWWAPICAFPVVAFLTILLPILSFRRKDTSYAFAKFQDEEFEVRHGIASLFRK